MERGVKKEDRIKEINRIIHINSIILSVLIIFVLIIILIFMFLILKPQIKHITKPLGGELGTTGPISAEGVLNIDSCQILSVPGTYLLTKNLEGADIPLTGCFNITASNIELNCNGYFIRNIALSKPGIYAGDNLTNITIRNCNVRMRSYSPPSSYGIQFSNVNDSFIINSSVISNTYGIYLSSSSNNQIINNTADFNYNCGIYLTSSLNNTIINNTANSNVGAYGGIYLESNSNNNQIIDNTANSNTYPLIGSPGIHIKSSLNTIIIGNTANSNTYGIYLNSYSNNNQIINNTVNSNAYGFFLTSSSNNNLTGNTMNSNGNGISLTTVSSYNTLTNNHIWNCTDATYGCIFLSILSSNNLIQGGVINLSSSNLIYNGYGLHCDNNIFKDLTLLGATKNDTFLTLTSINNTFLNVSYDLSKEYVASGSQLIRKLYLDININNGINPLNQAIINTYNFLGNLQSSSLTDIYGNARQELIEYINIGSASGINRVYYSNYSLNVSKSGYYNNSNSVNMTSNKNIQMTLTSLPPTIYFVPPTPLDGVSMTDTAVPINVSIYKPNLDEFKFNWNGVNYIPYDKSLVLMYNFDNLSSLGESSTFIKDLSKYGNDGTCSGSSCPTWTSNGKFGGAMSFNGMSSLISVTNNQILNFERSNFTLYLWYKSSLTSPSINQGLIYKRGDINPSGYNVHINYLCQIATYMDDVSYSGVQTNTVENACDANWHNVAVVMSQYNSTNSNNTIYIDGIVSISTLIQAVNLTNTASLLIGGQGEYSQFFNGTIDEVRIWNRSLSAEEVKKLYASNLQKYNSSQWYFYANQINLGVGTYSYFAGAKDTAGNESMTETRTITVSSPGCVGSSCGGNNDGGGGGANTPKNKTNVTIKSNVSDKTLVNKTIAENNIIEIPISNPAENKILKIIPFVFDYTLGIIFLAIIIILILLLIKDRNRRIIENKIKSDEEDREDDFSSSNL